MTNFWENFLLEIVLFTILGILYYFYQKKKIIEYEKNKNPLVVKFILNSCLAEKKDEPQPELDSLIESLDDYLLNKSSSPPLALLKKFITSKDCSPELKDVISEGIKEIEMAYEKK